VLNPVKAGEERSLGLLLLMVLVSTIYDVFVLFSEPCFTYLNLAIAYEK